MRSQNPDSQEDTVTATATGMRLLSANLLCMSNVEYALCYRGVDWTAILRRPSAFSCHSQRVGGQ